MRVAKLQIPLILCLGFGLTHCQKQGEDDKAASDQTDPVLPTGGVGSAGTKSDSSVAVPNVGSINLSTIADPADAALMLADDSSEAKCDRQNLGAFGLAIGAACHTSGFASKLLLGSESGDFDGNGSIDCGDFQYAKSHHKEGADDGPGILLNLMCQGVFLNNDNVTSFAWEDLKNPKNKAMAVSFADYENDITAVGSWTKGNAASYPADIRIWGGDSVATALPVIGMGLTSLNNGVVAFEDLGGTKFKVQVEYANKTETANCIEAPSKENCHWQDIKLFGGDGLIEKGPPNQFHLRIFADSKDAPTFLALEGRYGYSAESAAKAFAPSAEDANRPDLRAIRSVYFQVVKKGGQVWGRLVFKDENDELLKWETASPGGTVDIMAKLAADDGICQNSDSAEWVTCDKVTYTDYADLWEGSEKFESVTASPVKVEWLTGKPEKQGLCNINKCIDF
jgi:hypothetical protein